mmetsp:Transcript_6326/g.16908  ORF Transcript_6326/g.16908 Transcript_6326/m.16908 type:complete len:237 (-) Transcript_6326:513-1223(-)
MQLRGREGQDLQGPGGRGFRPLHAALEELHGRRRAAGRDGPNEECHGAGGHSRRAPQVLCLRRCVRQQGIQVLRQRPAGVRGSHWRQDMGIRGGAPIEPRQHSGGQAPVLCRSPQEARQAGVPEQRRLRRHEQLLPALRPAADHRGPARCDLQRRSQRQLECDGANDQVLPWRKCDGRVPERDGGVQCRRGHAALRRGNRHLYHLRRLRAGTELRRSGGCRGRQFGEGDACARRWR